MSGKSGTGAQSILDTAEDLFRERGYRGVSLEDVARSVGIRKPSIYYHFPGGKEHLFVSVQRRMFERIGDELRMVVQEHGGSLRERLARAAEWFFDRPPMFILSMMHHDMPAISDETRATLTALSYGSIMQPLVEVVSEAAEKGELKAIDPHVVAGGFLALLEGNTIAARAGFGTELHEMMMNSIDMIIDGVAVNPR